MFGPFKSPVDPLDAPIARVIADLDRYGPETDEYPKLIAHLEKLHKMKAEKRPPRVSRDTVMIVLGNLVGILIIVIYEEKHVISSKAFPLATRGKN